MITQPSTSRSTGAISLSPICSPVTDRLTVIQEYSYIVLMKATIDIPDVLYRRVKAKSALQGQPIREVAMRLFLDWIEAPEESRAGKPLKVAEGTPPAWFGAARKYARQVTRHDMDSVHRSIDRGRVREALSPAPEKQER